MYHLAQINIGRMRASLDDPIMAGFVGRLDEVNAVADTSPGFVWRLQTAEGDATSLRPYDDDRIIVNMSVWESVDALMQFVFRSSHLEVLKDRAAWFERFDGPYFAMWWIPVGRVPTVDEGKENLELLRTRGESADAFTFRSRHPPPSAPARGEVVRAD